MCSQTLSFVSCFAKNHSSHIASVASWFYQIIFSGISFFNLDIFHLTVHMENSLKVLYPGSLLSDSPLSLHTPLYQIQLDVIFNIFSGLFHVSVVASSNIKILIFFPHLYMKNKDILDCLFFSLLL